MKKHSKGDRVSRRRLVLRLEHLVQLTPEELRQVSGGSSLDYSCSEYCSKPG